MIDCPKFDEMQKMFHGKSMTVAKVQPIAKTNNHCGCECGGC
jgi:hypothetical protein